MKHALTTTVLFVSLLSLTTACGGQQTQIIPDSNPTATDIKSVDLTGTPSPSGSGAPTGSSSNGEQLKVVIQQADNYSASGLALLEKARGLLERVVNSQDFKDKVLSFTYSGSQAFVQNLSLNNQQIYDKIRGGAEMLPTLTASNQQIDLFTSLYTSNWFGRNTVGYTTVNTPTIYMNTYFFNSADAAGVAGNMMHEWLHKIGFDHDSSATTRRPYSVPYAIGYIVEGLVKALE